MIYVKLSGGLGNQMFEYATSRSIQLEQEKMKYNSKLYLSYGYNKEKKSHEVYELDKLNISKNIIHNDSKFSLQYILAFFLFHYYFHFVKNEKVKTFKDFQRKMEWTGCYISNNDYYPINSKKKNICLKGWFQSPKYFNKYKKEISSELRIITPVKCKNLLKSISKEESVCIHVRRGDYVNTQLDVCSKDYYNKAIEILNKKYKNLKYYIFSNDIDWCKKNLSICDAYYVEGNSTDEDLRLMYSCKHFVISNSTYSWWAQYLSKRKGTVIAPNIWSYDNSPNELYDDNWLLIDCSKKNHKKVSIIVPAYNASKFIDRCTESLVKQTYRNIEILIVDDGSNDNTLVKMKLLKKKYPGLIRIFTQKNGGVGSARNKGIDESTGCYLIFVDADDYLDDDFVESMVSKIGNNDVIVSGYRKKNVETGVTYFERNLTDDSKWDKYRQLVIWAKMYKTSFIKENKIYFNNLKMGEDIIFSLTTIANTKKYTTTSYVGYNNIENMQSVTHNDKIRTDNDLIALVNTYNDILGKNDELMSSEKNLISYLYMKTLALYLIDKANLLSTSELIKFYNDLYNEISSILKKHNIKIKFLWQKSEPFKVNFFVNLIILCQCANLSTPLIWLLSKTKVQYK